MDSLRLRSTVTLLSFTVLAVMLFVYNAEINYIEVAPRHKEKAPSKEKAHEESVPNKKVDILYWNPLGNWKPDMVNKRECFRDKCRLTFEKSTLSRVDAVLFHAEVLQRIPKKETGQVWVFYTLESPDYCGNNMNGWNHKFNWTWTYRRDSDIVGPYGSIRRLSSPSKNSDVSNIANTKSQNALWIVSHCKTTSKRELYVNQLKRSFSVDILGNCGRRICPSVDPKCKPRFLNGGHRFFLTFENSLCRDYATEKIFDVLRYNIVPIVRAGYNTSMYLPKGSFIDVNDFHDPSYLGQYLKILSSNNENYANYFKWRKNYEVHSVYDNWCVLCSRLHNKAQHQRLYRSVNDWWRGNEEAGGKMCNRPQQA